MLSHLLVDTSAELIIAGFSPAQRGEVGVNECATNPFEIQPNQYVSNFICSVYIIMAEMWIPTKV